VAPDDTWTWVDFPGALCASGTPTGLAVNPHAGATQLLIYLQGGGFCADGPGCWGAAPTANNLEGYDAGTFFAANNAQLRYPALDRKAAGNPFAGMNMVFIPYCTGDLHSGDTIANLRLADGGVMPTYFYGAHDLELFLQRLVPTFASTARVWLIGTSAGGFGTLFDFNLVANAFGVGVDIIDDSGPPLVGNGKTDNAGMFAGWSSVLPDAGFTSLAQLLDYDLQVQTTFSPPGEFGFLSFEEDTTIAPDFGYDAGTQYPPLMLQFSASLSPAPTAATFLVYNYPSHVVESALWTAPIYFPWMTQMVTRDAGWADEVVDGG
jgi:hypothetical protein